MPPYILQSADILLAIRKRICTAPTDGIFVLKETELATEFGMSRTPIRQVLQYLAYSDFVETQAGVGTVAVQLKDADLDMHIKAYENIALAAAACATGRKLPPDVAVNFMSVANWISISEERGEEEFVKLMAQVITNMLSVIDDSTLSNAYRDAHWRLLRWRVLQLRNNPDFVWESFERGIAAATRAARSGDAAEMLRTASGLSEAYRAFQTTAVADENVVPYDRAAQQSES